MAANPRFPIPRESLQGIDTFPLPLTGIEHFWLWDDTSQYPKRFRVALQFVGTIDWDAWNDALRLAVSRHPMLVAHLTSIKPLQWVIPTDPAIRVCWGKGDFGTSPFESTMDLTKEAGLRIWGGEVDENHPNAKPEPTALATGTSRSNPEPMALATGSELQAVAKSTPEASAYGSSIPAPKSRYFFVVECHHAVSDGLGLRQCVAEWIVIYDRLTTQSTKDDREGKGKLVKLDPSRLADRGVVKRPLPTADSRPPTFLESLKLALYFLGFSPKKLASISSNTRANNHIHRVHILSPEETESVLNVDDIGSATFNDLAVAAVLKAVDKWNQNRWNQCQTPNGKNKKPLKPQRLRVMIPVDLRSIQDMRMPAANRLGFGFVVADSKVCLDRQALIARVVEQTKALRQFGLGWDFPELFNVVSRMPKIAKWITRIPLNGATAVVTNLGDLTRRHRRQLAAMDDLYPRCGDLKLEAVFCVPPLRPKTSLGIGLCRCGDSLAIGLIVDGSRFSEEDTTKLLDSYVQTLITFGKSKCDTEFLVSFIKAGLPG